MCISLLLTACGSHDKPTVSEMLDHKRFDFLTEDIGTRELYAQHRGDSPEMIATLKAALRSDARPKVRQNAIVALTASPDPTKLDAFIGGLDDRDPTVVSEAGFSIAAMLQDVTFADPERRRALAALRAHAQPLRNAFASTDERVRFNVMVVLEAIVDHDFDIASALQDDSSLIPGEGLALATLRANQDTKLSPHDVDALGAFVRQTKDPQFREDTLNLLVRFSPAQGVPLLIGSIADDTISYQGFKSLVELKLTAAVPAIVAFLEAHPGHCSTSHLETLTAFHATCAAPLLARLFEAQRDDVQAGWIRDALLALSGQRDRDLSDKQLIAWAKRQAADAPPCR